LNEVKSGTAVPPARQLPDFAMLNPGYKLVIKVE
jgi:hypothetical protein